MKSPAIRRFTLAIALALGASLSISCVSRPADRPTDPDAESRAQAAALQWLNRTDAADYAGSWHQAAAVFKSAITPEQWETAVRRARAPLGALESRTLDSSTYTRSVPGGPDGEYVILKYKSRFEKKASAVETVTPMKDPDGNWRVSGYYIK